MFWRNFSVSDALSEREWFVADAQARVRAVVEAEKRAGKKISAAIAAAARALGLSERRVRGYFYREVMTVAAHEYETIKGRFATHLDEQARRLDAEAALLRARRSAIDPDVVG